MKVWVRNEVYDGDDEPLVLLLEDSDKENIKNMDENYHIYCEYPDNYPEKGIRVLLGLLRDNGFKKLVPVNAEENRESSVGSTETGEK